MYNVPSLIRELQYWKEVLITKDKSDIVKYLEPRHKVIIVVSTMILIIVLQCNKRLVMISGDDTYRMK